MRRATAVALLAASACIPGNGPMMRPFEDCNGCHSSGGDAKAWSAAGTWAKGATVTFVGQNGRTFSLQGNDAGNFYTRESFGAWFNVSVNGVTMMDRATGRPAELGYGGCNACHRAEQITVGPDMAPGSDCLTCHRVGGIASNFPFTAAGTFGPNQSVRVGNQTTTTRPVSGNFYVTGPLSFPATATVGGASMEGGAPSGHCNAAGCHAGGSTGGD